MFVLMRVWIYRNITICFVLSYTTNRPQFLLVYQRENPLGMLKELGKNLLIKSLGRVIYKLLSCSPNNSSRLLCRYTDRKFGLLLK